MRYHEITEHTGANMPARFYIDGKRVSREAVEDLKTRARMYGRLECFHTSGTEKPGGRTRRTNRSTAAVPGPSHE